MVAAIVLAGCAGGRATPSRKDCEAVLAHLVVLERDSTPVMCRYHPDCGGDDEDAFLAACPKVLSRRELGCYQRATTVGAADACLDREELAQRIETGVVVDDDRSYGGGSWDGDLGFARTPAQRAIAALRRLRDDACACHDATCAARIEERFRVLISRWDSAGAKPSKSEEAEGERVYRQYAACLEAAKPRDPPPPPY